MIPSQQMPKVSVIIPVFNVEEYLGECLDSILGQTLREIEVVCVDDGSTDGSAAILDTYAAKDGRVKVLRQPNAGAGAARNAGLAVATGEYLLFCDPDDWCEKRCCLDKVYECLKEYELYRAKREGCLYTWKLRKREPKDGEQE